MAKPTPWHVCIFLLIMSRSVLLVGIRWSIFISKPKIIIYLIDNYLHFFTSMYQPTNSPSIICRYSTCSYKFTSYDNQYKGRKTLNSNWLSHPVMWQSGWIAWYIYIYIFFFFQRFYWGEGKKSNNSPKVIYFIDVEILKYEYRPVLILADHNLYRG